MMKQINLQPDKSRHTLCHPSHGQSVQTGVPHLSCRGRFRTRSHKWPQL